MTIEFTPDQWYLGLWWVGHHDATPVEDRVDWLGGVWRAGQGGADWILHYRFRYHNSPEPFGDDKKNWYTFTVGAPAPASLLIEAMQKMQRECVAQWQGTPDCLMLRCRGDQAIRRLLAAKKDWLHVRQEPL